MPEFYVTFGQIYSREAHPKWAPAHPDGWLTIEAINELQARNLAIRHLGVFWSMMYEHDEFRKIKHYFPRGELARLTMDEHRRSTMTYQPSPDENPMTG